MTPKHHTRFLNSGYSHLPKHGPAEGGPFVELDAADAAARGLADGDTARVWNDRADASSCRSASTDRLRPGVVADPVRLVDDRSTPTAAPPTRSPTTRSPTGAAASPSATRSVQIENTAGR